MSWVRVSMLELNGPSLIMVPSLTNWESYLVVLCLDFYMSKMEIMIIGLMLG